MTTINDTTIAAEKLQGPSAELQDATNWASGIVNAAINMDAGEELTGQAKELWSTASSLFESARFSAQHRKGLKLRLDALLMQPEVLIDVAREAGDHLVATEAAEKAQGPLSDDEVKRIVELLPALSAWLKGSTVTEKPDFDLRHVMEEIDGLTAAAITGGVWTALPPAGVALFKAGCHLVAVGERHSFTVRAGHLLNLTALLQAPEVLPQVLQNLRSALLDADPQLAPLAGDVTPLAPVPLAVNHTIDGLHLDMLPDGSLEISGVTDGPGRFEPADAYALATFLRLPAVAALLETQEVARQTEQEGEQEASMAEEAVRMAAR